MLANTKCAANALRDTKKIYALFAKKYLWKKIYWHVLRTLSNKSKIEAQMATQTNLPHYYKGRRSLKWSMKTILKLFYCVAMIVLRDPEFKNMLKSGVWSRIPWMRDAAGIIFCLYSLSMENKSAVTREERSLLDNYYRAIMDLVKSSGIKSQGHFHGVLYTQAMGPYICAL